MIEVLRSAVNPWDCDVMGHLNVRHYTAHGVAGLAVLGLRIGLGPARLRTERRALRAFDQHLRFHRELRAGAGFVLHAGVLDADPNRVRVYQELRMVGGEVAATMITELGLVAAESGTRAP